MGSRLLKTLATELQYALEVFQEACQLYERVGYHDFEGIVLDASEKKRLIKSLGKSNHTLVLRNHGLITAGPSAIWAFIRHQVFIRNAEIQLRAMSSGGKIIKIPKKIKFLEISIVSWPFLSGLTNHLF